MTPAFQSGEKQRKSNSSERILRFITPFVPMPPRFKLRECPQPLHFDCPSSDSSKRSLTFLIFLPAFYGALNFFLFVAEAASAFLRVFFPYQRCYPAILLVDLFPSPKPSPSWRIKERRLLHLATSIYTISSSHSSTCILPFLFLMPETKFDVSSQEFTFEARPLPPQVSLLSTQTWSQEK